MIFEEKQHPVMDNAIGQAVVAIDAWLDTMRGPDGYGGPVVHWWQDCLRYTGAGLDWRYEGIILGYLTVYERTRDNRWLVKARRAGDDLVQGQLENENFRASSFEANPHTGGTPHEAACDLALIRLAQTLRENDQPDWERYACCAEQNLRSFILNRLWDPERRYFRNIEHDASFTPNKAATIVEALFAWSELSGQDAWFDAFILPTLDHILECQVSKEGSRLDGAIDQSQGDGHPYGRYFPFYVARCIPALVLGYRITQRDRYIRAALAAIEFILRHRLEDGSFPQVIYSSGRQNIYPRWIAAVGDILRAMHCLAAYGLDAQLDPTLRWLLDGLLPSGGMRTASGFARRGFTIRQFDLPEFRDLLPVCGWVDKAFYFLASMVPPGWQPTPVEPEDLEMKCMYKQRRMCYVETNSLIELKQAEKVYYRWYKGEDWAEVA